MSGSLKLPFSESVPSSGLLGVTGFKITVMPSSAGDAGIQGVSPEGIGILGTDSTAPLPQTSGGSAIPAPSGVVGISSTGRGLYGNSAAFDAVVGETQSSANAGVTGRNLTTGANGGVGIYGIGGQYAGKFDGAVLITGVLSVTANATHSITGILNVSNTVSTQGLLAENTTVSGTLNAPNKASTHIIGGILSVAGDVQLANADCAEDFDVASSAEFTPGSVMVLNE